MTERKSPHDVIISYASTTVKFTVSFRVRPHNIYY